MGIREILIPQEKKFFDLLEKLSSQVRIASTELSNVFAHSGTDLVNGDIALRFPP